MSHFVQSLILADMVKIHTILFVFLSTLFVSSQAKNFISENYAQEAVADDMVRHQVAAGSFSFLLNFPF